MYRRKLAGVLAFIMVLPLFFSAARAAAEPVLANAGFSAVTDGVPEGWNVLAYYEEGYSVSAADGVVTIDTKDINDIRLCQTVTVESNTDYVLTAEVSAAQVSGGRGATLSIDNYSLDGSCIYSTGVYGSSDWQTVRLAFRTGDGQTAAVVALRLGGYSEVSSGTVRFRNVTLALSDGSESGVQSLTAWGSSAQSGAQSDVSEAREIFLKSVFDIILCVSILAAVILIFGFYRNRERLGARELESARRRKRFALLVLAGFVVRSVLCSAWDGHDSDMSCWIGWGSYIAQNGPATFYTAAGHEWYDYPPGYMLVLGGIARLLQLLHISAGSKAGEFAYMVPAFAADILCAVVLMKTAREQEWGEGWALLLGGLAVCNPAAVFLSGAWGQIDSILTLFLLLTFRALLQDRRVLAGALYGLAVMIKWQAFLYGPVLAAAFLLSIRSWRDAGRTLGGVAAAFGVIIAVSLPFRGNQGALWLADRFLSASGGYDYASVEAYNFLALCGGNWTPSGRSLVGGLTYKMFGTAAIIAAVCLSVYMVARVVRANLLAGRPPLSERGNLYLAAAFGMYMIYTFGHYMHERYVFPVIFLLLFAYVYYRDRRLLLSALFLTVVVFCNEMTAMYVVSGAAASVVRSGREHLAMVETCSLAETASFLYFAWVCLTLRRDREKEVEPA